MSCLIFCAISSRTIISLRGGDVTLLGLCSFFMCFCMFRCHVLTRKQIVLSLFYNVVSVFSKSVASCLSTLDRLQSTMLLIIDECGSKIARNWVFDCRLLTFRRQMTIKNTLSNYFYLCSLIVLKSSITAYPVCLLQLCSCLCLSGCLL